jgi:ribonuclease P protein component
LEELATARRISNPVDCERVNRKFRLRKTSDFMRVRRMGKSYAHPLIVLIAHQNDATIPRFAIAAGRSVGKAVQRNRAKRLLREAVRPLIPRIAPGWDIVLLARHPLVEAGYAQVQAALLSLLQKANLLASDNGE